MMMNNTCVVTFFYPGIENKINNFFDSLKNQKDKKFDLIIFFNNKKNFIIPKNNININIFKLNYSIVISRFKMINKLKKLKYNYYIFQDADDIMQNNRVKICKNFLKKYKVVINDLDICKKKIIKKYFSKRIKPNSLITAGDLINYNICGMSNTALRRECLKKITVPISKEIKIFDWYFWTIVLAKYKALFTSISTTKYFINYKSATHIPTKYNKGIISKISSIKKKHKKTINELIKKKKIKDIYLLNKNIVKDNIKYNFWWE